MRKDIEPLYRALELKPGASPDEIARAYRLLMKQWHPDRFRSGSLMQKTAEDRAKEINEAYEKLFKQKLYKQYRPASQPMNRAAAAAYRESAVPRERPVAAAATPTPPPPPPKPRPAPPRPPKPAPPRRPLETRRNSASPRAPVAPAAPNRLGELWRQRLARLRWRWIALGLLLIAGLGLALTRLDRPDFQYEYARTNQVRVVPVAATVRPTPPAVAATRESSPAPGPSLVTGSQPSGWSDTVQATRSRAASHFDRNSNYFADEALRRALAAARRDDLFARYRPGRSELDRLIADIDALIDTFEAGDLPSRVMKVQGLPDEMTLRVWRYGSSLVFFKNGYVDHWSDGQPQLRVRSRREVSYRSYSLAKE